MTNLIINRVNYILSEEHPNLYLSKIDNLIFRMQFIHFKQRLSNRLKDDTLLNWLKELKDEDYIYYSFTPPTFNDFLTIKPENYPFNYFKAKFVREQIINFFKARNFLVEPFPKGKDLSVYEKIDDFNNDWSIYRRYDLLVRTHRKEIAFNIGSEKTIISNQTKQFHSTDKIRIIDTKDNFVKPLAGKEGVNNCRIVANKQKRDELGISTEPRKFNYNTLYNQLVNFYNNHLLSIDKENFKIEAGGLKNVDLTDLNKVNINENLMLFGKEKTDINAVTGMRDYGIYKPSPKATDVKFIFVYENSRDANQLYLYLKNGLKHYPGLWSYVGIPIRLSDIKLQYNGTEDLKNKIDNFISENLNNEYYSDLFVIVINPNSSQEKEELDENEDPTYYTIKRKFLEKGIPTQFIQDKNIHSGSFHYFLPNISIGILAKLGGIPWRLKTKRTDELVIGFNQKTIGEHQFIGSAVFFSNDGQLGKTFGFPETNSETALIGNLKSAIEQFISQKELPPERLVIHYYKPQSGKEQKSIEDLIQKELRLNIPFAIVEINDSKSQMDICFDKDFSTGMPESGTYVRVSKTEYLLFNNTRYQKNPLRSVAEELPIKISIHFADTGGFSHRDLISQVYEFSRLYWKGLKQRSQPATTIYSKLIAEFTANYNGELPNNDTVNNTPWFL
ncbi:MAG: Piwi domain-containing protein [Cyclobacteriaceae bacterium]|nr:Piwi domain-containing protein [Cyclobacteriaceae bacterium]